MDFQGGRPFDAMDAVDSLVEDVECALLVKSLPTNQMHLQC